MIEPSQSSLLGKLRRVDTHSQETGHLDSETNTCNENTNDTENVNLGKNTKEDCGLFIKTGIKGALWDSGTGCCVNSFDCYNAIPDKYKTELFPNKIKIKAANGSQVDSKGECDITFRIGKKKFTFPFLVSSELTQQIIL